MASRVFALFMAVSYLFGYTGSVAGHLRDDGHRLDHEHLAVHSHHGETPHHHSHEDGHRDREPLPFDSLGVVQADFGASFSAPTAPVLPFVGVLPTASPDLPLPDSKLGVDRDTGPPLLIVTFASSSSNRAPPLG